MMSFWYPISQILRPQPVYFSKKQFIYNAIPYGNDTLRCIVFFNLELKNSILIVNFRDS